jgi:hypothetical protein
MVDSPATAEVTPLTAPEERALAALVPHDQHSMDDECASSVEKGERRCGYVWATSPVPCGHGAACATRPADPRAAA